MVVVVVVVNASDQSAPTFRLEGCSFLPEEHATPRSFQDGTIDTIDWQLSLAASIVRISMEVDVRRV